MSLAAHILEAERNELKKFVISVNELLDTLEYENSDLPEYLQKKFDARFKVLLGLLEQVIRYDAAVISFYQFHSNCSSPHAKDQLAVAMQYIKTLGGDYNTVLWGKREDY